MCGEMRWGCLCMLGKGGGEYRKGKYTGMHPGEKERFGEVGGTAHALLALVLLAFLFLVLALTLVFFLAAFLVLSLLPF